MIYADATKSRSSCRTLPLTNSMKDYLMEVREKQRQEKEFLGSAYIDSGYVCVATDGTPLTPNVVSMHFRRMIRKSGLPYIRFHDAPVIIGVNQKPEQSGVDLVLFL